MPVDPAIDIDAALATIRQVEGGSYTGAPSSGGSASGAYQFTDATWLSNGGGKYAPHAYQATKAQQDEIARAKVTAFLNGKANLPTIDELSGLAQVWYLGHVASPAELDQVPGTGNKLTVREYTQKWLKAYTHLAKDSGNLATQIVDGVVGIGGKAVDATASAVIGALGDLTEPFLVGLKRLSIIGLAVTLGIGLVGFGAWRSVKAGG